MMVQPALALSTTRATWEQAVDRYRLFYPKPDAAARHEVDWMRFPPMKPIYAGLVADVTSLPPTPEQFETAFFAQSNFPRTDAIRWRLLAKFYPSFVAEQHLALILLERFRHVTYSDREDLAGIDIHLAYRGLAIGVASAIGSDRSRQWEVVKRGRHPESADVWLLRLYRIPEEYEVGPFWLHDPDKTEAAVKAFATSILA